MHKRQLQEAKNKLSAEVLLDLNRKKSRPRPERFLNHLLGTCLFSEWIP